MATKKVIINGKKYNTVAEAAGDTELALPTLYKIFGSSYGNPKAIRVEGKEWTITLDHNGSEEGAKRQMEKILKRREEYSKKGFHISGSEQKKKTAPTSKKIIPKKNIQSREVRIRRKLERMRERKAQDNWFNF